MTTTIDPQAHDEAEAKLYHELAAVTDRKGSLVNRMHRAAGDKKIDRWTSRERWSMTHAQVLTALTDRVADMSPEDVIYGNDHPVNLLRAWNEACELATALQDGIAKAEAVWQQHRWSRFILCVSSNGHIHNFTGCHTLRPTSLLQWHPEFSGLTEDEAVNGSGSKDGLGPILCTHCFPSAPVAFKQDPAAVRRERAAEAKAAKLAERQRIVAEREARQAERDAKPRKTSPADKRVAGLKALAVKYPTPEDVDRAGRESVAAEVLDTLLPLGRSERWTKAVTAWANVLRNSDESTSYAWFQCSIFVGMEV